MGVNLRDLFPAHAVPLGWYHGKRIAVDGHNVAYRYLTTIRHHDGDVLRSDAGRVTSHLYGFLGLVTRLRERGAEPIIVWDGPVHERKMATVARRIAKREEMATRAAKAQADGDVTAYHRLLRATTWLDGEMIEDCTRALDSVGVAVVTADHDGERYAAALCAAGHAEAVATEDYDALVAGAPAVLRKAGGARPFLHHLRDLDAHKLAPGQLRQVAIVCGTDWHPGVKGFGAKTAVQALHEFGDLGRIFDDVAAGRGGSRFHRLVAAGGMAAADFRDLEAFIAAAPEVAEPRARRPSPEQASAVAEEFGLQPARLLACLC
jgi:flap endonuclease-1